MNDVFQDGGSFFKGFEFLDQRFANIEQRFDLFTVGEYRSLLESALNLLEGLDGRFFDQILDQLRQTPNVPAASIAIIEQYALGDLSAFLDPARDILAQLSAFDADVSLIEALSGGIVIDDGVSREEVLARIEDFTEAFDDANWLRADGAGGASYKSFFYGFDPATNFWSYFDEAGQVFATGVGEFGFFSRVAETIGDAVVDLLGDVADNLSRAEDVFASLDDLGAAEALGQSFAIDATAILQESVGEVYATGLAARIEARLDQLVSDLSELTPEIASSLTALYFGSRNSDASFEFGLGSSSLEGSAHEDRFALSDEADVFNAGLGDDLIAAGGGGDTITGGAGRDLLSGGDGNDRLKGDADRDTVFGGDGDDALAGGGDNDRLRGDDGNDVVRGNTGRDRLFGQMGEDTLVGGASEDTLKGGQGDDRLVGGGRDDRLFGGAGDDTLKGGGGGDRLLGGAGDDELTGGAGSDRFLFRQNAGDDVITDFENGTDLMRIQNGAESFADLSISQSGADLLVGFTGATILIRNAREDDIGAEDFLF